MVESMLDPSLLAPERIRPYRLLQRKQYDRLVERGVFTEDDRIELLRGQLVEMSPQGEPHSTITARLHELFVRCESHRTCMLSSCATRSAYARTSSSSAVPPSSPGHCVISAKP